MEFLPGMQVISIKVTIITMKERDMERCFGLMVVITKVSGIKECNKDKVHISLMQGIIYTV